VIVVPNNGLNWVIGVLLIIVLVLLIVWLA
jgi:hypothetical protein